MTIDELTKHEFLLAPSSGADDDESRRARGTLGGLGEASGLEVCTA